MYGPAVCCLLNSANPDCFTAACTVFTWNKQDETVTCQHTIWWYSDRTPNHKLTIGQHQLKTFTNQPCCCCCLSNRRSGLLCCWCCCWCCHSISGSLNYKYGNKWQVALTQSQQMPHSLTLLLQRPSLLLLLSATLPQRSSLRLVLVLLLLLLLCPAASIPVRQQWHVALTQSQQCSTALTLMLQLPLLPLSLLQRHCWPVVLLLVLLLLL